MKNNNGFTVDELGFIQLADTKVLAAAARGEIDINKLARDELANRGLDAQGKWVGFKAAAEIAEQAQSGIEQIARRHLHIETLATRNSDRLDFHNVSVGGIKAALEEAYHAGISLQASRGKAA